MSELTVDSTQPSSIEDSVQTDTVKKEEESVDKEKEDKLEAKKLTEEDSSLPKSPSASSPDSKSSPDQKQGTPGPKTEDSAKTGPNGRMPVREKPSFVDLVAKNIENIFSMIKK